MKHCVQLLQALVTVWCFGCGSEKTEYGDGGEDQVNEPSDGADARDDIVPDGDVSDQGEPDLAECMPGQLRCGSVCCEAGQVCTPLGGCCDPDKSCAGRCCGESEECVLGLCRPICPSGIRCGEDLGQCCDGGQVCSGGCVTPGGFCDFSFDCPAGNRCERTLGRCLPVPSAACEYFPPTGAFDPVVQWTWEGSTVDPESDQSIVTPLVVQLTDDNGDGDIDRHDVPDVVFSTYPEGGGGGRGRLRAVSGDDGTELWTAERTICAYSGLAAGDIDADGSVEIITAAEGAAGGCRNGSHLRLLAFDSTGALKWESRDGAGNPVLFDMDLGGSPAIADIDSDGFGEIVVAASVTDHDGTLRWSARDNFGSNYSNGTSLPAVADVNGDGRQEIVGGNAVYLADGTPLWSDPSQPDGFPAVASFLEAGRPEVVVVSYGRVRIVSGLDGTLLWGPMDIPGGGNGGAPTVADFDGDGRAEFGVAGLASYTVYDPLEPSGVLWSSPTYENAASVTGSSVFDFENDGKAEVVYADECFLRVYDGETGEVVFKRSSTSGTHLENPVVADVDNDGNSEIVIVSSIYHDPRTPCEGLYPDFTGYTHGVYVYGDRLDNWVATRRIWNQHTYHITNIYESGGVPLLEHDSWTWFNSYRLNGQDRANDAPDLLAVDFRADYASCPGTITLLARVANNGSSGVPAGLGVTFYRGLPSDPGEVIATVRTTDILLPGSSLLVQADFAVPGGDPGPFDFFVRIDDEGDGTGIHNECDETNNTAALEDVQCPLIL
jgi:hypothetical protein